MKKKNLFPRDNFAVLCPTDYETSIKWKTFIAFLNSICTRESWGGDQYGSYYGMSGGRSFSEEIEFWQSQPVQILSLDDWYELALIEFEDNVVTLYNDDKVIVPFIEVVQLCYESNDSEEWALKSRCIWSNYYDGYLLKSEYTTTYHGQIINPDHDNDDISWSEYHDAYLDTQEENVYWGYVHGCRHETYFVGYGDTFTHNEYCYRDGDAASYHGLVWSARRDEWVDEDDYEDESFNADYHELRRTLMFDQDDEKVKFTIGFEIEKEDSDAVEIKYEELYDVTRWIKENDGSLDRETGYELVTPAYNLYDSKLDEHIQQYSVLQTLINANYSSNCGGHINIASKKYTTDVLFEHLSGWFPLLYAIYENRLERNYSQAKKKYRYYDRDKYAAIYIKSNVLEIRLPSAVKNVSNLLWRRDLVRIMCDSIKTINIKNCQPYDRGASEIEVLQMMMNPKSKLYKHLRKVFSHDRLLDKIEAFIRYSESYNDKALPRIIRGNMKDDNLGTTEDLGA